MEADHLHCVVSVMAVVGPTGGAVWNGFVNYDDPAYVVENRHVKEGLTWEGVAWAFTASYVSNWHPLTWLSLMLDHDLFGMNAAGYHWTSVILHGFAGLVLFLALGRMTGRLWCSGSGGGSVSGSSAACGVGGLGGGAQGCVERSVLDAGDVGLRGGMRSVALWARYAWVLLFFVLGLLSKPMVVTFPFVLLLLDYWPLGTDGRRISARTTRPLVYEKIPLFVLSAAASAVTFWCRRTGEAVASSAAICPWPTVWSMLPFHMPPISVKMVWPFNLAVFYPHPGSWPAWDGLLACCPDPVDYGRGYRRGYRRRPYLLDRLALVSGHACSACIGLVQVGAQAMADRYTYLPLIGIFIMAGLGLQGTCQPYFPNRPVLWGSVQAGVMVVLDPADADSGRILAVTAVTLSKTPCGLRKAIIRRYNHLGRALAAVASTEEASENYREAIRISPNYMPAYNNLGIARMEQGRLEEAMAYFDKALEIKPGDGQVRLQPGGGLCEKGDVGGGHRGVPAGAQDRIPIIPIMHNNLGLALDPFGTCQRSYG
ncbi:MAG: tetratricopeptide repeat protein [Rhodopseudomonas palustris]|nr:tetratricopeptide repeat protein [Rhodopseudomonas palustris]